MFSSWVLACKCVFFTFGRSPKHKSFEDSGWFYSNFSQCCIYWGRCRVSFAWKYQSSTGFKYTGPRCSSVTNKAYLILTQWRQDTKISLLFCDTKHKISTGTENNQKIQGLLIKKAWLMDTCLPTTIKGIDWNR